MSQAGNKPLVCAASTSQAAQHTICMYSILVKRGCTEVAVVPEGWWRHGAGPSPGPAEVVPPCRQACKGNWSALCPSPPQQPCPSNAPTKHPCPNTEEYPTRLPAPKPQLGLTAVRGRKGDIRAHSRRLSHPPISKAEVKTAKINALQLATGIH